MQIFSVSAYHLEQPHTQSLFLFPRVFDIVLRPFIDVKGSAAVKSIVCLLVLRYLSRHLRGAEQRERFFLAMENANSLPRW